MPPAYTLSDLSTWWRSQEGVIRVHKDCGSLFGVHCAYDATPSETEAPAPDLPWRDELSNGVHHLWGHVADATAQARSTLENAPELVSAFADGASTVAADAWAAGSGAANELGGLNPFAVGVGRAFQNLLSGAAAGSAGGLVSYYRLNDYGLERRGVGVDVPVLDNGSSPADGGEGGRGGGGPERFHWVRGVEANVALASLLLLFTLFVWGTILARPRRGRGRHAHAAPSEQTWLVEDKASEATPTTAATTTTGTPHKASVIIGEHRVDTEGIIIQASMLGSYC